MQLLQFTYLLKLFENFCNFCSFCKFWCCRIMQPPGGSSNLFGEDEAGGEEEAKTPAAKKPDRGKISFSIVKNPTSLLSSQDEVEL